jgi:hypothetical protein
MSEADMKKELFSRFSSIHQANGGVHADFIAQSAGAYEKRWKRKMPDSAKAILQNSFNHVMFNLQQRGVSKEAIMSATADISRVDNPITLLFNLMSILIPNFAYTLWLGLQPLPTKDSPIFYPEIRANEDRNSVKKGSTLLGATNWNVSNNFSTNRNKYTLPISGASVSAQVAEKSLRPGSVNLEISLASLGGAPVYLFDDGEGNLVGADGFVETAGRELNYATGEFKFKVDAAYSVASGDSVIVGYRYDIDALGMKPAQAVLEWVTKMVRAEPYRLRHTYSLDNFYQVKQVLSGYNIDQVLSTSLAGIINKEVSGSVFDDALIRTDADYVWDSDSPTGVSWAEHRLSLLQTFVRGANGIRQNIARSGGNVVICGNEWMNFIETLGGQEWAPVAYNSGEPIGPYEAGTLLGKYKIIKNQDYPDNKAVMGYKKDDTDASMLGGVFIGLYSTNPIAQDDLTVVQGMGTQFGHVKAFENSIVSLTLSGAGFTPPGQAA